MTEPQHAKPTPRRRSVWRVVLFVWLLLAAVFVAVGGRIQLNYYAISPGDAQSVIPLVKVPPGRSYPHKGTILLTDVYVNQLTLLNAIPNLLSSNTAIYSSDEILGPYTPPDQLVAQGYLEMAQSQSAAKAAALTRLGYTVPEQDAGTLVFSVSPGS